MNILTDEIGRKQAAKYNLEEEYLMARRHGCNIIEALEDWDLIDDEFLKEYDGYELPKPTFSERLYSLWIYIRYPFLRLKFWLLEKIGR